ncbi:hypothetical protein [Streptomyces sp. NPDC087300]|uniref:hypothetical protein n=1 Tax=Streptomyces sp. NPDC087300 TaxID=3365780 RepID=UPI0037F4134F
MAENASCFSITNLVAARVTAVDGCGKPIYGDQSVCVFDGFSSAKFSPEYEDGNEVSKKKANGKICVQRKLPDLLKWVENEFTFCELDSGAVSIMNPTWPQVLDAAGNTSGFRVSSDQEDRRGFALELWADVEVSGGFDPCDSDAPDVEGQWEYVLIPWMSSGRIGELEFGDEGLDWVLTSRSRTNSRWGVGPHQVTRDAAGNLSPLLTPIGKNEPIHFDTVTVPPPEVQCGFQPLLKPSPNIPMPTGLTLAPTDTTVTATWDELSDVDSYDVQIRKS